MTDTVVTVDRADLEARVRQVYRAVADHPENRYHFETGRALAERLGYPTDLLDQVPAGAVDSFAGVGWFSTSHYCDRVRGSSTWGRARVPTSPSPPCRSGTAA